jgi:hypothetical protein
MDYKVLFFVVVFLVAANRPPFDRIKLRPDRKPRPEIPVEQEEIDFSADLKVKHVFVFLLILLSVATLIIINA